MTKRRRPAQWLPMTAWAFATISAGCFSPSPPSNPPGGETPAPPVAAFTLQECFMPVVLAALPTELDQSSMPPGFTLVPSDPATYTAEFRGLTCGRVDDREVSTGLLGPAWRVVPPSEFKDPAITDYEMSDGFYVQGDILQALKSWVLNGTFLEAAVTSTQTSLGAAATGSVKSTTTSGFTVALEWSAAGPSQQAGRTYRLFLVNSTEDPWRLVGAIDVTISDSSVLYSGAGYVQAGAGTAVAALPGKGAMVYSGFSVEMRPVPGRLWGPETV